MISKSDQIFITGATGLIGSYLTRKLWAEGYTNIRASRRKSSNLRMLGEVAQHIEWVEADVTDLIALEEAMRGVDIVFHTAAVVSFDPKKTEIMHEVNIQGTAHMVNLALDFGVKRFIHISSVAALGTNTTGITKDEKTEWDPSALTTEYSISKYKSEKEVWRAMAEGLPAIILNPSFILGGGDWSETSTAIWGKIAKGIPYYPMGDNGYVDVRDVVQACMKALLSDITEERFVISAETIPYQKSLSDMAHAIGAKPPKKPITKSLQNIVWRLDWLRSKVTGSDQVLTKASAYTTSKPVHYDNTKSKEVLGVEYRPLAQTIAEVGKLYLDTKQEGFGLLSD